MPSTSDPNPTSSLNGEHAPSPRPTHDESAARTADAEMWADVKKTEAVTKMIGDLASSPVIEKLVNVIASRQHAQARQDTRVRVAVVRAQERNAARGNFFVCIALVLCLAFLGVVINWLKADKDTLLPVLSALIGLIAGAGGGYVFGRHSISGRSD